MKTFKGFDKDLKCRGKQYEVGKDYEEDTAAACESGMHACEYPLDVFGYYPPSDSRYCEVEQDGIISKDAGDSKVASSKLKVVAEIGIQGIVKAAVDYIKTNSNSEKNQSNTGNNSAATNTGDRSAATNTGYRSAATNTGYRSAATNTGNRSAATNTGNNSAAIVDGKESVAIALGYESKARGSLGCWIVVSEWNDDGHIVDVQSAKVDGGKIKADTFYMLKDGEFEEAER